jgi:hypothetical protein
MLPQNRAVLLRNMVTVEEVDEDLKPEINDECSKIGTVENVEIFIDPLTEV